MPGDGQLISVIKNEAILTMNDGSCAVPRPHSSGQSLRNVSSACFHGFSNPYIALFRWCNQRKAFGKPLHSQAVVRSKLAAMISRVESVQSWLENLTHQMNNMVGFLYCDR